jgi:beta-glucosidase
MPSDFFFGDKSKIVTIVKGIKNAVGDKATVVHAKGSNYTDDPKLAGAGAFFDMAASRKTAAELEKETEKLIAKAVEAVAGADVIIAALGAQASWSGEASSRSDISIPVSQKKLLKAMLATGKPVVLVLVNGRPLTLTWEDASVPAILESWAGGTEAGTAIADILFGDYNPSGKLTMTFPRNVGQIPIYYNHKNTGRPFNPSDKFSTQYLDVPNEPLYPFGYGLSYTTFAYGDIIPSKSEMKGEERLTVSTTITNTGEYAGEEVVQLYIGDPVASVTRAVKELKDFRRIALKPGEKKSVTFTVTTDDLKFWNSDLEYVWEPGDFHIYVGSSSDDVKQVTVRWLEGSESR